VIIVMKVNASQEHLSRVLTEVEQTGCTSHTRQGKFRTVVGIIGEATEIDQNHLTSLDGVEEVVRIMKPFKFAAREFQAEDTVVNVGSGRVPVVKIGGRHLACIAGPCVVESEPMLYAIASHVRANGASILGGSFRPQVRLQDWEARAVESLKWLRNCGDELGMPICSDVSDTRQVEYIERYVDLLQVSPDNMQNFALLREIGKTRKPVLLSRGPGATVQELLMSADYVLLGGNRDIILCDGGIKTFEDSVRYSMDITSLPVITAWSHLPIIVNPCYSAGKGDWVPGLALAGVAAGAHGLIVEVHPCAEESVYDGPQAVTPHVFARLMCQVRDLAPILNKRLA
jgi:3-deoxy-7-phosphoheptulonate synthase